MGGRLEKQLNLFFLWKIIDEKQTEHLELPEYEQFYTKATNFSLFSSNAAARKHVCKSLLLHNDLRI